MRDLKLTEAQIDLLKRACRPNCYVSPMNGVAKALWNRSMVSIAPGLDRWLVNTLPAGRSALKPPAREGEGA